MSNLKRKVIILRGIPGSGKSRIAEILAADHKKVIEEEERGVPTEALRARYLSEVVVCSADKFFEIKGQYIFDRTKVAEAHASCYLDFIEAIFDPFVGLIVVDNTNIHLWEYKHYVRLAEFMATDVSIYETGEFDVELCFSRQKHGVPKEVIERMAFEYEEDIKFDDWKREIRNESFFETNGDYED